MLAQAYTFVVCFSYLIPYSSEYYMNQKPSLTISSLDAERIENMIESMGGEGFPGKDALETELARATIVEPQDMPANIVTMNSTVKFKEAHSDKEFSLTLVYPQATASAENTISILAPIGAAIIGMKEGDQIDWPKAGGGVISVQIIQVLYQPEREGVFHR